MSPKPEQVALTPSDVLDGVRRTVRRLMAAVDRFDAADEEGMADEARDIANLERNLLHDGQGPAALRRVGLLNDMIFPDTAGSMPPEPDSVFWSMVVLTLQPQVPHVGFRAPLGAAYRKLDLGTQAYLFVRPQGLTFKKWWRAPALRDSTGHVFTRREFVLALANTDGGAHTDDKLDLHHFNISRDNSFGFSVQWNPGDGGPSRVAHAGDPSPVMVRQIAWELLRAMQWSARPVLPSPYISLRPQQ